MPSARARLEVIEGSVSEDFRHRDLIPEDSLSAIHVVCSFGLPADGADAIRREREPVDSDGLCLERAPTRLAGHVHTYVACHLRVTGHHWVVVLENRAYRGRNASLTVSVGPLRCFATLISARPTCSLSAL